MSSPLSHAEQLQLPPHSFVVNFSYGDALYLSGVAVVLRSRRTGICWCVPVERAVAQELVDAFCGSSRRRALTSDDMIAIHRAGAKGLRAHEQAAERQMADTVA